MADEELFQPIQPTRVSDDAVDQILDLIAGGHLKPGDQLPSERELVRQLGVSRASVREALRTLEAKGIIEVKPGKGIYVSQLSSSNVSESIALLFRVRKSSLLALHEVREVLETEIAGFAAERATEEEKEEMEKALRYEAEILDSLDEYVEADLRFHELLTKAAHNEVLPVLLNPLAKLLRESRRVTSEPPASTELSLQGHREICEAVKNKDKEQAREAMRRHLQLVRKTLAHLGYANEDKGDTALY